MGPHPTPARPFRTPEGIEKITRAEISALAEIHMPYVPDPVCVEKLYYKRPLFRAYGGSKNKVDIYATILIFSIFVL